MSFSLREPGLLISSVAHVAVLVGGLVTFSGEAPFPDADEGIPVTFITEEQFSQAARGEPDARREDEPTRRVDRIAETVNDSPPGEARRDCSVPPTRPQDMAVAETPEPEPEPEAAPEPDPQPEPESAPRPEPAPEPENPPPSPAPEPVPMPSEPDAEPQADAPPPLPPSRTQREAAQRAAAAKRRGTKRRGGTGTRPARNRANGNRRTPRAAGRTPPRGRGRRAFRSRWHRRIAALDGGAGFPWRHGIPIA